MSPDIPLEILKWFFQFGTLGFLVGFMALYAIFRGWHYLKLLSGDSEKHKPVFDEASDLIRSEHWGNRYRVFLQKVLEKLTGFIGDHYRFPDELPEKPRLQFNDPSLEKLHNQDTLRRLLGVNPFTVESYQFCFLLALIYPIMSFTVSWVISGNGVFGSLEIMSSDMSLSVRLGSLVIWMAGIILIIWNSQTPIRKSTFNVVASVVIIVSIIAVFVITLNIIGIAFVGVTSLILSIGMLIADSSTRYGALTVTGSGVFAFVGKRTFSVSGIAAAIMALVFIGVVISSTALPRGMSTFLVLGGTLASGWLYEKNKLKKKLVLYWFFHGLVFLTASLVALNLIDNTNVVLVLLFYLILPLINAPLDWLSLGITRALLQSIRFNHHRFGRALVWSLVDLGLAVVALLLVSGVMVSVVSLANLLTIKPIVDLQNLFNSLNSLENWQNNLWIYFMLLSTLIPTAIHFALAGGALTLAVSNKQRRTILKDIETNDLSAKKAWMYVSLMPAFGFVLAPTLLLFSLYWVLHAHGAFLGNALLSWAELLATWIDPTLGQLPKLIGA